MDTRRVSIIIVTWNALPLLKQCLPSVVATNYPNLEIIVADNASDDGSAAWVESEYPAVKVVRHPQNWRFCKGNNRAVPYATGDYILLLNNDVEVPPGWLHPLVEAFEADPEIGAAQPKMLQYDDRNRFEYAGGAGGFIDRVGYPFTRGRLFDTMERDRGQYDTPTDIFWASGAAIMMRRRALQQVGLLDERFDMHMEEIDLCWRMQRAGYRIRYVPESEVYHIGGASLPKEHPEKTYLNFRNSLLMLYKNLPPHIWPRTFAERVLVDAGAVAQKLAQGQFRHAAAIVHAYVDAHRMRTSFQQATGGGVVLPPYRRFIALDYFALGRRTFAALPVEGFDAAWGAGDVKRER